MSILANTFDNKKILTYVRIFCWSERRGSNPQPQAWEACAIPLGHFRITLKYITKK